MGLTIHWTLKKSKVKSKEQALKTVAALRDYAETLREMGMVDSVSRIYTVCDGAVDNGPDDQYSAEDVGALINMDDRRWMRIPASEGYFFDVDPGYGSEWANFGLMKYPRTYRQPGDDEVIRTKLTGWSLHAFSKTQYASEWGLANFLRAHLGIIAILDYAKDTLGMTVEVSDEGDYYETRNLHQLVSQLRDYNNLVQSMAKMFRSATRYDIETSMNYDADKSPEAEGEKIVAGLPNEIGFEELVRLHRESLSRMQLDPIVDLEGVIQFIRLSRHLKTPIPELTDFVIQTMDGKYINEIDPADSAKAIKLARLEQDKIKESLN